MKCLTPSITLLIQLGSIAVHADEMNSYNFDQGQHAFMFDKAALETALNDSEVKEWISEMTKQAFVPLKRN